MAGRGEDQEEEEGQRDEEVEGEEGTKVSENDRLSLLSVRQTTCECL